MPSPATGAACGAPTVGVGLAPPAGGGTFVLRGGGDAGNLEFTQLQDFLGGEAVRHGLQLPGTVDAPQDRQVRDHDVDARFSGERIGALPAQLRTILAVAVLHHHDQRLLAGDQVHRAADTALLDVGDAVVGDAALLVDLVGAEHDGVEPAASCHLERLDTVEVGGAGQDRDVLAGRVEGVLVDAVAVDLLAVAEDAVLAVQDDIAVADEVGDEGGHPDAEVDVAAVLQHLGDAAGHLQAGPPRAAVCLAGGGPWGGGGGAGPG